MKRKVANNAHDLKAHLIKLLNPQLFYLDMVFIYVSEKGYRLIVLNDEIDHVSEIHPTMDNVLQLFTNLFGSRAKYTPAEQDWETKKK